jgi:hypothetical protein
MASVKFKREKLLPVIQYCLKKKKDILFVKDNGVYFMAKGTGGDNVVIAYAEGCNPHTDDEERVWSRGQALDNNDFFETFSYQSDWLKEFSGTEEAKQLEMIVTKSAIKVKY